jgi:hypothetical protein
VVALRDVVGLVLVGVVRCRLTDDMVGNSIPAIDDPMPCLYWTLLRCLERIILVGKLR